MSENEKQKLIVLIYDIHSEWLHQVAFNFSGSKLTAQDLVQDMFVMLLEMKDISKIKYNNTVNLYYLYKTLRSLFLNRYQKHASSHVPLPEVEFEADLYSYDKDDAFEDMLKIVNETLQRDIHWFDAMLLDTYLNGVTKEGKNHSINSLHKETKISTSSIWTSLKNTREIVKGKLEGAGYNHKSYKQ
jgi:hypothetical protein